MTQTNAYQSVYHCDYGTAKRESSRLMTTNKLMKPYVESLIRRQEQTSLAKLTETVMQPQEIKARLSELARANLVDFIDEDGRPRLTRAVPHHSAAKRYYRKSRTDRNGNPVETSEIALVDQIEALRELAKIHGLYAPSKHVVANVQFNVEMVDKGRTIDDENT